MPHYDYLCRSCGKKFEFFQSMSSEPLTNCPVSICEQQIKGLGTVERKIGKGAGLIFNGSGFYQTDYVRSGDKAEKTESAPAAQVEKTEPAPVAQVEKTTPAAVDAAAS